MGQRGQSTLEWVIGAAVILGTLATHRDYPSNHGTADSFAGRINGDEFEDVQQGREGHVPDDAKT